MNKLTCSNCGEENLATDESCKWCGNRLTSVVASKETLKTSSDEAVEAKSNRDRVKLAGIIFAVAMASITYRLLVWKHLEQTSALFIGVPTLLALAAVFLPRAKSATGMIMKVLTIALLISGILLGEGFICIVMAAPLFYLVGLIYGLCYDYLKRRNESNANRNFSLLMLPFLLMGIEGTHEKLAFTRDETVTVERIVTANAAQIEGALSQEPRFEKSLPLYLQLGFPKPVSASGAGLRVGGRRTVKFAGGEGKPGELILEIAEVKSNAVRFRAVSDTSHIAHWLDWKEAEASWTPIDKEHTRVSWTLNYTRRLDPAWYFAFWERYGVSCAANYLIDTFQ